MTLTTQRDGKVRTTLKRGSYCAYHGLAAALQVEGPSTIGESEGADSFADMTFDSLVENFEVGKTEIPQFFRLNVNRARFDVELLLSTRFEEPVKNCNISVREHGDAEVRSQTSEIGLLRIALQPGKHFISVEPDAWQPYAPVMTSVEVREDGSYVPQRAEVPTPVRDVQLFLITPDGEPAEGVEFGLRALHLETDSTALCTNESGVVSRDLQMLEPYVFEIKKSNETPEYLPQRFEFITDRTAVTAVVARSVFGRVKENRVVFLLDTSGSMAPYLEELKRALSEVFVQQFCRVPGRYLNIVAYSSQVVSWREDLVPATEENITSALRFISGLTPGGGTDLLKGMETAFSFTDVQAVSYVSDGKAELGESLVQRIALLYYSHPGRPRINTVGINCFPRKRAWKSLSQVSLSTRGAFRPVCLAQEADPDPPMLAVTREPWEYSLQAISSVAAV